MARASDWYFSRPLHAQVWLALPFVAVLVLVVPMSMVMALRFAKAAALLVRFRAGAARPEKNSRTFGAQEWFMNSPLSLSTPKRTPA